MPFLLQAGGKNQVINERHADPVPAFLRTCGLAELPDSTLNRGQINRVPRSSDGGLRRPSGVVQKSRTPALSFLAG